MAELTPLAVTTLALLAERPMHPYEMYQTLRDRHEDRLVKVSVGSLYATVNRLADAEFVSVIGTEQVGNRPERTTYQLLDRGRRAMRQRIARLIEHPEPIATPFHVAIAEAHNLPLGEVIALLGDRLTRLDAELADIDLLLGSAADGGVNEAYYLAGQFAREMTRAERDWIAGLRNRLQNGDLTWPGPQ